MKINAMTSRGTTTAVLTAALALAATGPLAGCRGERSSKRPREFLPDMDNSPKWKPQVKSTFFEDSRTMRPTVAGTVPFGENEHTGADRARFLKDDTAFYTGITSTDAAGNPAFLVTMPVASFDGWPEARDGEAGADLLARREAFMSAFIERGRQRYNIYCSACHGYEGDGQGMVGTRWASPVANFHDPKYVDVAQFQGQDGYIFNVIRHGVPFPNPRSEALRMPSYGHAIDESDAWAVVAYLRTLQAMRTGLENIPPASREQLRNVPKPAPKQAPDAAAPAAQPSTPPSPSTPPAGNAAGGANS